MIVSTYCHLNLLHDDDQKSQAYARVWGENYNAMKKDVKKFPKITVFESIAINRHETLDFFITKNELFIGIQNDLRNSLSNIANLNDVLYVSSKAIDEIRYELQKLVLNEKNYIAPDVNLSLWGKYITKIRAEEHALSCLPRGVHITRSVDHPFVVDIRKAKPFNNHDFAMRFNFNTPACLSQPYMDGKLIDMQELKGNYGRVYNLFVSLQEIQKGADLSDEFAKDLLDYPYERDELIR